MKRIVRVHTTTHRLICPIVEAGGVAHRTGDGTIHIEGDPRDLLSDPAAKRTDVITCLCGECIFHMDKCSPLESVERDDWEILKGATSLQLSVYGIKTT